MLNTIKLYLAFLLSLIGFSNQDSSKGILEISEIPPLKIYSCDSDSIIISSNAKNALMEVGMTQCMMPFGVLLSADENMPRSYLEMSGKILAELLDQDIDGTIDDSSLFTFVSNWEVGWLAMPTDHEQWENEQLQNLINKLGYDIIIPSWWMNSTSSHTNEHSIAVMVEEITHFLTQFGYGPRYPNEFGVENWSSIIAQDTMNAQCDVVEFYHQVRILRAGMQPGWFGIGFPTSSDQLEELLSDEIKELMDDPTYHQLNTPLTFNYPIDQ